MEGGPAPATAITLIPGSIQLSVHGRRFLTIHFPPTGTFRAQVPVGTYEVAGNYSPRFHQKYSGGETVKGLNSCPQRPIAVTAGKRTSIRVSCLFPDAHPRSSRVRISPVDVAVTADSQNGTKRESDAIGEANAYQQADHSGCVSGLRRGSRTEGVGLDGRQIEWTDAEGFPLHGTYVGPQAVVDGVLMRLGEIGDEFTVTPTRFVAEDDTVVATGTYSWKHRSTGKPAVVQMAHVWTFRDGRVIAMQQQVDTLKVQELST